MPFIRSAFHIHHNSPSLGLGHQQVIAFRTDASAGKWHDAGSAHEHMRALHDASRTHAAVHASRRSIKLHSAGHAIGLEQQISECWIMDGSHPLPCRFHRLKQTNATRTGHCRWLVSSPFYLVLRRSLQSIPGFPYCCPSGRVLVEDVTSFLIARMRICRRDGDDSDDSYASDASIDPTVSGGSKRKAISDAPSNKTAKGNKKAKKKKSTLSDIEGSQSFVGVKGELQKGRKAGKMDEAPRPAAKKADTKPVSHLVGRLVHGSGLISGCTCIRYCPPLPTFRC